jgi:hypothetical protein
MTSADGDAMTAVLARDTAAQLDDSSERCACGHAERDHDAIAFRYCAATRASDLSRGCICCDISSKQH